MAQAEVMPVVQQKRRGKLGYSCVVVIWGAPRALTRRKLIPALYNLAKNELLSRELSVLGVARAKMNTEEFRKKVADDLTEFATGSVDPDLREWFVRRMHYLQGDFKDKNLYSQLKELLEKIDKDHATHGNYFYYLATGSDYFGPIVEHLAEMGLMETENRGWRMIIVEKPFGRDLESARALNKQLLQVASEKQIYRIDHYLGKETVQNILAFRFANGIFEPIWRSEEHTSELQSQSNLVCRLLLEKKKKN